MMVGSTSYSIVHNVVLAFVGIFLLSSLDIPSTKIGAAVVEAVDSINMQLQNLNNIDLTALGTQDLDSRYDFRWNVTVDSSSCEYIMKLNFRAHPDDVPGDSEFTGNCEPNTDTGNAPDGRPWHAQRRRWIQFPDYVCATTGFNHMSMYWRPCGHNPGGLRQARYDFNFYTIIPQYRAFMTCQEYNNPAICQPDQPNHLGRGFFTLPRLDRDPNFLANMPLRFQPDPTNPEAYQYEGLIAYDPEKIPPTPVDWELPQFLMSTYDGDVVSWRAMIPHHFMSGVNSSYFFGESFYVFQTMPQLPSAWNMTYTASTGEVEMFVIGAAGMCGSTFDDAKDEETIEIEIGVGSDGEGPSRGRRVRGVGYD